MWAGREGLTATPDRTAGKDLDELCDDNPGCLCDLAQCIEEGRLAPIAWRSTKFDTTALTETVNRRGRQCHYLG